MASSQKAFLSCASECLPSTTFRSYTQGSGAISPAPLAPSNRLSNLGSLKAQRIASHLSASSTRLVPPLSLRYQPQRLHTYRKQLGRVRSGSPVALQPVEELPPKLQEIVKLFEAVPDPRTKYEQLLHYAKKLTPLAPEHLTKENKVEGCVSQVWVLPSLGADKKIYFQADSDSVLTKGLAALLVEGLSGSTTAEILRVTPDFTQMLGLKQSLTPSRSNGFLNMLKLMQKKTLQLYMEAEGVGASKVAASIGSREVSSVAESKAEQVSDHSGVATGMEQDSVMAASPGVITEPKAASIKRKIEEALSPTVLELEDVSHQHAGHAGVHKGALETHFNLKVVSKEFEGRSLVRRHRLIYDLLHDELKGGVHALSLVTKTPAEFTKM